MKKLLLSLALLLGIGAAATATEYTGTELGSSSMTINSDGTAMSGTYELSGSNFTLTVSKGSNTNNTLASSQQAKQFRIYKGYTLTIAAPDNVSMKSIKFTLSSTYSQNIPTVTVGSMAETTAPMLWTSETGANSVTFTATNGQFRFDALTISTETTITEPIDPVDPVTPEDIGSAENPCSVTEALNAANALTESQEINAVAKGTISAITELSTQFGNATYTISDGTSTLSVYRGYGLNGDKFTSEDAIKVGDEVVVSGKLVNFKGNTPQFTTGSKILSINGGVPEVKTVDYADIAAFLAAANTTDQSRITGVTTAVYQNGRYLWIKDNSGVTLAYNGGDIEMPKFANGQTIEGGITGKYQNYSQGNFQMSSLVAGTFVAGAQGAAVEAELLQIEEVATDMVNTYVRFEGVTITEGTAANNYVMSDASGEIALFNQFNNAQYYDLVEVATGENLTVYGFVAIHSGAIQILPVKVTNASGKEVVAAPTFSVPAGEVAEGTEVAIECATEGATIYYTLDGTNPTAASTVYSTPVVINEALTIKAIAVKDGMDDSAIASAAYTIKEPAVVTGNEAMFNFADPTTLDPAKNAPESNQAIEVPGVIFSNNGISLVGQGGGTTVRLWLCGTPDHGVEYRVYSGGTVTISAQEGLLIKSVEFTGATLTRMSVDGTALTDASKANWTSEEGVKRVIFDVAGGRVDIATVKVTFEKASEGVADIEFEENAPAEYYNLQGVRMNGELTPGLYIRRQGNKATKVIVK